MNKWLMLNLLTPMFMQILITMIISVPSKKINFHPINFMMLLMILTTLMCIKMNFMMKSWTPFLMFLIFIGGLLIILIYVISLTNNNFTKLNFNDFMLLLMKLLMFFLFFFNFIYLMYSSPKNLIFNYYDMNINSLFNYNMNLTFMIMLYLLFSMICIMNVCNKYKSPFRQLYLYE